MYSYYNQLLLEHLDDYFILINSIHSNSTRLFTCNNYGSQKSKKSNFFCLFKSL